MIRVEKTLKRKKRKKAEEKMIYLRNSLLNLEEKGKRNENVKAALAMQDNSWNSNSIIIGLIKGENRTNRKEAIIDGITKK